jgi:hypothetical protein
MSTINNISLRAAGEKHLGRSEWCIPIHVSVLTSLTIFAGLYCNNTVTETVVASVCAAGIGLWLGFNAKLEIQETAFILLAQSDLFHLLEVQTLKPEKLLTSGNVTTNPNPIELPQETVDLMGSALAPPTEKVVAVKKIPVITKKKKPNPLAGKKIVKKTI